METVSTMGSGDLGRELDLAKIVEELKEIYDVEVKWHSDSMATIRLRVDGPAISIYRTGGYQIRGPDSRESLFEAQQHLIDALQELGMDVTPSDFQQKNAVYLENFNQSVDLETLVLKLGLENVEYEPEQFPGAIYRPDEFRTVLLIFSNGKAIISGTIDSDVAEQSANHLKSILSSF